MQACGATSHDSQYPYTGAVTPRETVSIDMFTQLIGFQKTHSRSDEENHLLVARLWIRKQPTLH